MSEATLGDDYDYPPDNSDRTWHLHDDDTWGWGISCTECLGPPRKGTYRNPNRPPGAAIHHLKRQNSLSQTTREEEREMLGDRWNDPKVQRAR